MEMESLIAMVAFSEAPFDRTSAASSLAAGNSSSSSNVPKAAPSRLALLAANKWPMERLAAMMAFCEAPFDGAWAPSPGAAAGGRACATNVPEAGDVASSTPARLAAAAKTKKRPVERLVATMAFCEAPFDGTFDGTSSDAAGDVEDTAALRRRPWLADAKELERAAAGEREG